MCNLYSEEATQAALRKIAGVTNDRSGNLPLYSGIYPDTLAPVIRKDSKGELEMLKMRWGMPNPPMYGGYSTNIRKTESKWWRRWLGPQARCLVPATAFCEWADERNTETKKKEKVWFALAKEEPPTSRLWTPLDPAK